MRFLSSRCTVWNTSTQSFSHSETSCVVNSGTRAVVSIWPGSCLLDFLSITSLTFWRGIAGYQLRVLKIITFPAPGMLQRFGGVALGLTWGKDRRSWRIRPEDRRLKTLKFRRLRIGGGVWRFRNLEVRASFHNFVCKLFIFLAQTVIDEVVTVSSAENPVGDAFSEIVAEFQES